MGEKISVTLPSEIVRIIEEQVSTGAYISASEVIREALRVWRKSEDEHKARLQAIRSKIERSLNDPRPDVPLDDAFARLHDLHQDSLKAL